MIVTPNTEVRLLSNVPLNNSYEHQLTFNSASEQASYFIAKETAKFSDFTYQREDTSIRVPQGRDSLYSCNYIMYRNSDFSTKWFYGFITKLEFVNPEMTKVHFEIDVYQTWMFDMEFNPSYIAREHCKRWNADGTPIINTVDEGLNYGDEYQVVSAENYKPNPGIYYLVCAVKKKVHDTVSYYASINGLPQLMSFYVTPFQLDGTNPNTNLGLVSQAHKVLALMYHDETLVNNVVSIYVTDCLPNNPSTGEGTLGFDANDFEYVTLPGDYNGETVKTLFVKNVNYGEWSYVVGDKYDGYVHLGESKLLMYPYSFVELTDMRGNKATFKNEYIENDSLMITISASLGMSNKVLYSIQDYLTGSLTDSNIKMKASLEHGLISDDPNDLPVMTDMLSAYLQGNRNTLQNQKTSIIYNGVMGGLSAGMGAVAGGPMAPFMLAEGMTGLGNAYLEIQGLNAKQKDIANTPPQISKLGSNTYFDYGNGLTGVWIVKKQITPEYQKKLSDFFHMYGYKLNEVKVPNLKSREHFNFIQTVGANITGNIPGDDLKKLKAMFDTGVTLWHGDYVGDYLKVNSEV